MTRTQILSLLVTSVLAILTFDQPAYFGRVCAVGICLILLIFGAESTKGLISLILIERLSGELFFYGSELDYSKIPIYVFCFYALFRCRHDNLAKYLALPVFGVVIVAELYWYTTGYNAPQTHYYCALIAVNLIIRDLIWQRTEIFKVSDVSAIDIDFKYYFTLGVFSSVIGVMLIEYLIRHITSFSPMWAYQLYPLFMHLINFYILFLITEKLFKLRRKNSINA